MKRQGTDLEKIYSNDVSYDGHIFKIYIEPRLNKKQIYKPVTNGQKSFKYTFYQRKYINGN